MAATNYLNFGGTGPQAPATAPSGTYAPGTDQAFMSDFWKKIASGNGIDPNGNNVTGDIFPRVAAGLAPAVFSDMSWLKNWLTPERQRAIQDYVTNILNPANLRAQMGAFNNSQNQQAAESGGGAAQMLRGLGYGDGAQSGAIQGASTQAQRNIASNYQQQNSPEAGLNRLMAAIQAMAQGAQSPSLAIEQQMYPILEQRHQQNQSEVGSGSWLSGIASVAGQLAGAGAFGPGGGLGRGSRTSTPVYNSPDRNSGGGGRGGSPPSPEYY